MFWQRDDENLVVKQTQIKKTKENTKVAIGNLSLKNRVVYVNYLDL